jgi:hypothetical protein
MMFRLLLFRLSRRRAVATIIGGLIILSLILTALGTMVFVSQQYDQYEQTATKMAQHQNQGQSENLVANSPGLQANLAWSGCGGCNMYNMSLSNLGGVGVQIARIYISSTGSGCTAGAPGLCILNPSSLSPTSSTTAFQLSNQFLNAGEVNHAVLLYLPSTVVLPIAYPPTNTILIVTSRGNVFSFQWPFPFQMGGQSQSAFSAGILKVAYTTTSSGYDSTNEPGHGGSGTSATGYCHYESSQAYPAGASYAENLTGITAPAGDAPVADLGNLWFVNPWVTGGTSSTVFETASNIPFQNTTTLYLAVNITNTGNIPFTVAAGGLDLTWYGSNHIDGGLIGIYYNATTTPQFYPISSTQTVAVGKSFFAIFRVTEVTLGNWPPANDASVMFWGSASLTDNAEGSTFVAGVSLLSGLWIRYSC